MIVIYEEGRPLKSKTVWLVPGRSPVCIVVDFENKTREKKSSARKKENCQPWRPQNFLAAFNAEHSTIDRTYEKSDECMTSRTNNVAVKRADRKFENGLCESIGQESIVLKI